MQLTSYRQAPNQRARGISYRVSYNPPPLRLTLEEQRRQNEERRKKTDEYLLRLREAEKRTRETSLQVSPGKVDISSKV